MIKDVEIEGLDEAIAAFNKLGSIGEKHMMVAFQEMAAEGVSRMKMKDVMPVVTARLSSSVHYEKPNTSNFVYKDNKGKGYNGMFFERPKRLEVIMGTNVEYAESVNYRRHFFEAGLRHIDKIKDVRMTVNFQKAINEALKR